MAGVATLRAWFEKQAPAMAESWSNFLNSVYQTGEPDRKRKELIAAATFTVNRCTHCTKTTYQKGEGGRCIYKRDYRNFYDNRFIISSGTKYFRF